MLCVWRLLQYTMDGVTTSFKSNFHNQNIHDPTSIFTINRVANAQNSTVQSSALGTSSPGLDREFRESAASGVSGKYKDFINPVPLC